MSKYEKQFRIEEKEKQGFQTFREWIKALNPSVTSVTPKPGGSHYDADLYLGSKLYKVEIKYMPEKNYNRYDHVILNLSKALDLKKEKPADMYFIRYDNNVTVTMSKKDIDNFIKNYGLDAFIIHTQNKTEMAPEEGECNQIQLNIPHTEAGNYYKVYNGLEEVEYD